MAGLHSYLERQRLSLLPFLIDSRVLGLLGQTETLVEATSVYSFLLRQYLGTWIGQYVSQCKSHQISTSWLQCLQTSSLKLGALFSRMPYR